MATWFSMKTKPVAVVIFAGIFFIAGCGADITKKTFSKNEMEMILQEFTSARINQYLYNPSDLKDNATLMVYLVKQHGYNYAQFIEALKIEKPTVFKKLFVKNGA